MGELSSDGTVSGTAGYGLPCRSVRVYRRYDKERNIERLCDGCSCQKAALHGAFAAGNPGGVREDGMACFGGNVGRIWVSDWVLLTKIGCMDDIE